jgi:hypothetical protein
VRVARAGNFSRAAREFGLSSHRLPALWRRWKGKSTKAAAPALADHMMGAFAD